MILRNKHASQSIGVTNKDNVVVFLNPGDQAEVYDQEGKGYLANYSHLLERVDSEVTPERVEDKTTIEKLTEQVKTLTQLVERLTNGNIDEVTEAEKAIIDKGEDKAVSEEAEKATLIDKLKKLGVRGVGAHWSITKLRKVNEELK